MIAKLKKQVWQANLDLVRHGLVMLTFGNASAIDRRQGLVVIKPSGLDYETMSADDMVVVDLEGKVVEGSWQPSSDTPTHLELYRAFAVIGAVVHTHSDYATMFAQAGREIPCLGTTHADCFNGPVPLTRELEADEVQAQYEIHTGRVIVERFAGLDPLQMPAVLVAGHGPFCWGATPAEAVEHNLILERVAKMAWGTLQLNPGRHALAPYLLDKHYRRKHGAQAYYGQKKGAKK